MNRLSKISLTSVSLICFSIILFGCDIRAGVGNQIEEGIVVTRDNNTITVTAGKNGLNGTPVAIEWDGEVPACLDSNGELVAAQQGETADGRNLIWILADISAGDSREYVASEQTDCLSKTFDWQKAGPDRSRLLIDDMPVVEYVHPVFDSNRIDETMKPFHHVYAPDGSQLITKGAGGNYSHHRGIFYGYNNIRFNDKTVNTWGGQVRSNEHSSFEAEWTGPVFGGHEVVIDWIDRDDEIFAKDIRKIQVYQLPGNEMMIDVESMLSSKVGPVELDGDHHHAGIQFRAAQYVYDNAEYSRFVRPDDWACFPEDREMNDSDWYLNSPWNIFRFVVEGEPYTVGYFSHPQNPQGGQMSERLYGRFGEFIPGMVIDEGQPLTLRYRLLIANGHEIDRERMVREYNAYSIIP